MSGGVIGQMQKFICLNCKMVETTNPRKGKILLHLWLKPKESQDIKNGVTYKELGKIINDSYQRGDLIWV